MTHVCRQCSRVNPADASFCYWDGAILAGASGGGPINVGSAPFPSQFIFPGGQICRNFDQLATTCQQHWQSAVDLLKQGFFSSFLGGLGRADLAMAANEAAKYPDADRGLDQLLAKLPTQVLQPPKVKVEPSEINLGQLRMGTDRNIELHLSNQGMRLAYGSIVSDCKWLTFGEGAGAVEKLFQFGADAVIPVHVKGQFLRAGNQPLEGHLVVDSNGGATTVTVRADVPITPFSEGVLAGSLTPRQIAEKARAHPKEAAAIFERGLVSQWFSKNGWIYPVQGPSVAGLGGVQQFFEALGLAKPPKVELKTPSLQLRGAPGQALSATLEVGTSEKKQVYAFAVSDQIWVVPGNQTKQGKTATMAAIPLTINVPATPGQVLQAKITITANGGQKFKVPLSLTVSGSPGDYVQAVPMQAVPMPATPMPMAQPMSAMPMAVAQPMPAATPIMATPMPMAQVMSAEVMPASPFAFAEAPATVPVPPPLPMAAVMPGAPPVPTYNPPTPMGRSEPVINIGQEKSEGKPFWFHLIPMGVLTLILLIVMIRDLIGQPSGDAGTNVNSADVDPTPRLALYFDFGNEKGINNTMNFGLVGVDAVNPKNENPKRLTYDHRGRTNSTVLSINGMDKMFGNPNLGKWATKPSFTKTKTEQKSTATWTFTPDPIFVTQTVEVIPGEAIEFAPGVFKRPLNTCLIRYKVENKDAKPHRVGLRVMIDTLIGMNDGTPFTIPGQPGLVATFRDFRTPAEIPDFIQALEEPDIANPGTVVQMNLKLSEKLAPDRVSLTHWPGPNYSGWEVRMENIGTDSAIVLYWNPIDMKPGESREMAFSYGLGNLKGGKLGITVGGTLAVNKEMTVIAYVAEPQAGETATLNLPKGFELLPGSAPTQPVPQAERGPDGKTRPSPVTWRVRPTIDGRHTISVQTNLLQPTAVQVTIRKKGIF